MRAALYLKPYPVCLKHYYVMYLVKYCIAFEDVPVVIERTGNYFKLFHIKKCKLAKSTKRDPKIHST